MNDNARLRHGRDRALGFAVGQYLQPAPLLFTRDGHNVFLGDMYRGRSAFLICGGPSLTSHNLSLLEKRGVLTMAVNNAATIVRPQLWCAVDDPGNFHEAIWLDPAVTKFVPLCHMEKPIRLRDETGELRESSAKVGDFPAVFAFRRNEAFVAEQFLHEDTINWGNHGKRIDAYGCKGTRSVMYVAFRLLYFLGVRQVFLLGCDFHMQVGAQNYAFDQDRSASSVRGNNAIYATLNVRLQHLRPHFESAGFQVSNCTPNSGLTVFPHIEFEEAIRQATTEMPRHLHTTGMYDRQARERQKGAPKTTVQNGTNSVSSVAIDRMRTGALVSSERLAKFPPFTVVVPISRAEAPYLQSSWATWMRFKPWLKDLAVEILSEVELPPETVEIVVSTHPLVSITPSSSDPATPWEFSALEQALTVLKTPWYLLLSPKAVATSDLDWLDEELFQSDATGQLPAFSSCRWGYTKSADIFQRLDDWADTVPDLQSAARLGWLPDPNSNRITHPAIAAWAFLGQSDWTRSVLALRHGTTPPTTDWSTFALYCAERQRTPFFRLPMKDYGWDHSFSWTPKTHAARCVRALASA